MGVFDRLNAAGRTIVLITHEEDVAAHAKRAISVAGRPHRDRPPGRRGPTPYPPLLRQAGRRTP